jgi:arachidonate 15-lipoxygenase
MSQPSLPEQQGHYLYNPSQLQQAGPARLFPYSGKAGTLKHILTELPSVLADEGKLSQPGTMLIDQLEKLSRNAQENWGKITTLLVDLEIFQSGWFNFNLPPDEQFNSDFVRLRRAMGGALTTAKKAAQAVPGTGSDRAQQQRLTFYQELEEQGRVRPQVAQIHQRDGGLSDREFARQRLAGPNPMVIEQMRDQAQVQAWQSQVAMDLTAHAPQLFTLDYQLLKLAPAEMEVGRYVGTPKTLFHQGEQGLEPLLIQPIPGGKVFTPQDGDGWMKAIPICQWKRLPWLRPGSWQRIIPSIACCDLIFAFCWRLIRGVMPFCWVRGRRSIN